MRLEDHPFFGSLPEEEVNRLTAHARLVSHAPGQLIFDEGNESNSLFLVLSGSVEFSKRIDGDTFHPVSSAKAGDFFGEIGIVTGEPRSLRAEAKSDLDLAVLEKGHLEEFIKEASGPLAHTLRSVIRHLHHTTSQFTEEVLHQEKMAVVGNMVNSIIHDFKNPVGYIRFAAGFLARKHDDELTKEICGKIEDQVKRMLDMAEEVRLYSRGRYHPSFTTIQLPDLMKRFRDLNFLVFENQSIDISIEVDDVELEADQDKLIRVFENLIGNALDAMSDSGAIRIIGKDCDPFVDLKIHDNAGGIPQEIRDRFFEPFVTYGKQSGTGLGSAIVKSIIEAHQGSITFDTKTGEGTEFRIRLPKKHEGPRQARETALE